MSVPCKSCHALIFWAVTVNGKAIPLDAIPDTAGVMVLRAPEGMPEDQESYDEPMRALHVSSLRVTPESGDRYTSHFATCPNAAAHRRRR